MFDLSKSKKIGLITISLSMINGFKNKSISFSSLVTLVVSNSILSGL